mmetsp:Transcript_61883/g.195553  ORF Transcript_61883/g.195553 Transcript_61883/m.195553 type:complete len:253 (+) Transcript_61883:504-1262(+)
MCAPCGAGARYAGEPHPRVPRKTTDNAAPTAWRKREGGLRAPRNPALAVPRTGGGHGPIRRYGGTHVLPDDAELRVLHLLRGRRGDGRGVRRQGAAGASRGATERGQATDLAGGLLHAEVEELALEPIDRGVDLLGAEGTDILGGNGPDGEAHGGRAGRLGRREGSGAGHVLHAGKGAGGEREGGHGATECCGGVESRQKMDFCRCAAPRCTERSKPWRRSLGEEGKAGEEMVLALGAGGRLGSLAHTWANM